MKKNIFNVVSSEIKGRHLIEASAGTGKTYSLIHIVLRLIVEEQIPIERLLVVTFTKDATAELRLRIRGILIKAAEAFAEATKNDPRYDATLLELIEKWRAAGVSADIFSRAIERLDDASVCTIHSFCQKMLEENKFSSSEGFDFEIGNSADLQTEVIEEFLREELTNASSDRVKKILIESCITNEQNNKTTVWQDILKALTSAPESAKHAMLDDLLNVNPVTGKHDKNWPVNDDDEKNEAALHAIFARFIEKAPEALKTKKRRAGLRDFNDLLLDMYAELGNTAFVRRIQSRYDGILIDEFQDTDPIQYTIFKRLFLSEDSSAQSVFFVGDPKQSIYRFRNADLNTYLAAQADIGEVSELQVNYRSSPELLAGINAFYSLAENPFLDSGVGYSPIKAGAKKGPLLIKKGETFELLPAFEIWTKEESGINPESNRRQQAELVASEIEALLSGNVYKTPEKKLQPSDIAVLVRAKTHVKFLEDALTHRGIRMLFRDESNIFGTDEAKEMLALLQAMESPQDVRAVNFARATRLMGESVNSIAPEAFVSADEDGIDDQAALKALELIDSAAAIWTKRGVSAAVNKIMFECDTQRRLLPVKNGERRLANYQQLIEVLQEASSAFKNISGLARWLKQQIQNPPDDERFYLRLDSDADLVNVMTIHKSKGLEFPVVFLLYANELEMPTLGRSRTRTFKEIHNGKIEHHFSLAKVNANIFPTLYHEEELELLRLGYVAMTRASQRLVLPLTYFKSGKTTVKGFDNGYTRALTGSDSLEPEDFERAINKLSQTKGSQIYIRRIDDNTEELEWHAIKKAPNVDKDMKECSISVGASRVIGTSWFPTSYTAIARGAAETTEALTLMQEKEDSEDELIEESAKIAPVVSKDPQQLTIMDFERGLESGTFLHLLFERANYTVVKNAKDGVSEAENTLNQMLMRLMMPFKYHLQPYGPEAFLPVFNKLLKDVLCAKLVDKSVFGTKNPLYLCDLKDESKTAEMGFTIAIGEPEEGRKPVTAKNLSKLLSRFDEIYHIDIENDRELRGYLTGAIDLCFAFEGKYFVLDWKGTKLGETPEEFTKERMVSEIKRHHYSLQYLIYLVALRRHLAANGIDNPDEKIAGSIYAFIRGIRADDDKPYGVFVATPPKALVACLDEFFTKGYHTGAVEAWAAAARTEGI